MRGQFFSFATRNIFNGLVTLLLTVVVAIHAYGWREREQLEDRLWNLEQREAARDQAVIGLEKSLDNHVKALQQSINSRCNGIENMIETLIKVLERKSGPEP